MRYGIAKLPGVLLLIVTAGVPSFGYQRKTAPPPDAAKASDAAKPSASDATKAEVPDAGKKAASDGAPGRRRRPATDDEDGKPKDSKEEKNAYSYNLPGPDGKDVPLSSFKGKVILVVNLARNSSYSAQLPALTKLSEKYQDKGLVVIGVPSNDFGAGEPGTDAEIQKVYKTDDKVPFTVTARSPLIGDNPIPFYEYLTKGKAAPPGGNVHWNYTKFLIDKSGKVIARLEPDVAPDSPEMLTTLDQIFSGTYKGKPKEEQAGPPSGGDQI